MMKSDQSSETPLSPFEVIERACARNTPIEAVRASRAGQDPPARGRMLELRDNALVLEEVHVIGREVNLGPGTEISCHFILGGVIYHFVSTIVCGGVPVWINHCTVLRGMRVAVPEAVTQGQRRNVYRVSVSARPDAPKATLWLGNAVRAETERLLAIAKTESAAAVAAAARKGQTIEAPPVIEPSSEQVLRGLEPTFRGTVADASDTGFGVTIPGAIHTRFRPLQQVWVRLQMPGGPEPLFFLTEVRHSREVPTVGARVGLLLHQHDVGAPFHTKVRRLVAYLTEVQRAMRAAA